MTPMTVQFTWLGDGGAGASRDAFGTNGIGVPTMRAPQGGDNQALDVHGNPTSFNASIASFNAARSQAPSATFNLSSAVVSAILVNPTLFVAKITQDDPAQAPGMRRFSDADVTAGVPMVLRAGLVGAGMDATTANALAYQICSKRPDDPTQSCRREACVLAATLVTAAMSS